MFPQIEISLAKTVEILVAPKFGMHTAKFLKGPEHHAEANKIC
jgi:hypothetical protein